MPKTSELEILQARGGHCGNGHLTSSGIAASETQHPQRQTLTLQTERRTVEKIITLFRFLSLKQHCLVFLPENVSFKVTDTAPPVGLRGLSNFGRLPGPLWVEHASLYSSANISTSACL